MTKRDLRYFTKLLAQTRAELAEIEASSHPFKAEFAIAWRKRIENIKWAMTKESN